MGWDAYSKRGRWSAGDADIKTKYPELHKAFKNAQRSALRKSKHGVDGYLGSGGLDLSGSGQALSEITGWGVYDHYGWDKDMVKGAWAHAKENRPNESDDPIYWWSAYYFLKACAENNLAIEFSY